MQSKDSNPTSQGQISTPIEAVLKAADAVPFFKWFYDGAHSTNITPEAMYAWAEYFDVAPAMREEFVQFMMRIYSVVGLVSEVGEMADMAKKHMRNGPVRAAEQSGHAKGWDLENLVEEVGDCLWYLATGLFVAGAGGLQHAMIRNQEKLMARKHNGTLKERPNRGENFAV